MRAKHGLTDVKYRINPEREGESGRMSFADFRQVFLFFRLRMQITYAKSRCGTGEIRRVKKS